MKIVFKNNHLSVENPRVTGSIPVSATNKIKLTAMWAFLRLLLFVFCNLFVTNQTSLANKCKSEFKSSLIAFLES